MISEEFVQTLATGIPVYAASGLVVWGQGWLWRRWLWENRAADLVWAAERLGGPIQPRFLGWSIAGPGGKLRLVGGLSGESTSVRCGNRRVKQAGWIGRAGLETFLADPAAQTAP